MVSPKDSSKQSAFESVSLRGAILSCYTQRESLKSKPFLGLLESSWRSAGFVQEPAAAADGEVPLDKEAWPRTTDAKERLLQSGSYAEWVPA